MRQDGVSQEWLDTSDITHILNKAYLIRFNSDIKDAQKWFCEALIDINSEAQKLPENITGTKEEFAIILDRRRLEKEKFGITLDEFEELIMKSQREGSDFSVLFDVFLKEKTEEIK